jgi:hypothetical protein
MSNAINDPNLVAACGLYCGACGKYKKGKCPGCAKNEKAAWCTVRTCCMGKGIATCAQCQECPDPKACKKFNNFFSKLIGFVLGSDRKTCIKRIREIGKEEYAREMSEKDAQTIRK